MLMFSILIMFQRYLIIFWLIFVFHMFVIWVGVYNALWNLIYFIFVSPFSFVIVFAFIRICSLLISFVFQCYSDFEFIIICFLFIYFRIVDFDIFFDFLCDRFEVLFPFTFVNVCLLSLFLFYFQQIRVSRYRFLFPTNLISCYHFRFWRFFIFSRFVYYFVPVLFESMLCNLLDSRVTNISTPY